MKQSDLWIPKYWKHSPMFVDQQQLIGAKAWEAWPDCNELNLLMPEGHKTLSGHMAQFYPQSDLGEDASYYEEHIFASGQIPTRAENWHDYFNAMIWLQFPQIKSAINALHVAEIEQQQEKQNRTRKRDALTLFDETGIIFVSSDESSIEALKGHEWESLFVDKRSDWWRSTSVYIFGHGLFEKALSPYIGMTANALSIQIDADFFSQDRHVQMQALDLLIAKELQQGILETPASLSPLPVLGVPGWWQDNNDTEFYNNKNYFRPKRK